MALFSDDDLQRIEAAVAAVEKHSATELVVAVLPSSGDYRFTRLLAAGAWALAAELAVLTYRPDLHAYWLVAVQVLAALVAYLVFGVPPLWRALIGPERAAAEVERRAFALFAERGLHRTRDRTGMLILVSELEHRVVILGDQTIHERVGNEGWQAHVDHVVASIRQGQAATGILHVIEELGRVHAELLPARADDVNELSDEIVRR